MRAPEFWNIRSGAGAAPLTRMMLEPLSWLYQAGANAKAMVSSGYRAEAGVICVGNLTLGGTGKTPMVIALMQRLREKGVDAHALTRGYGGSKSGPLLIDTDKHNFRAVGDESLLLARAGPTWVSRSKAAGAKHASRAGAQVIVMDDGFQNPTIEKDFSFVLIDGVVGLGNGRVFPAGPLRESVRSAAKRADAIVVVGDDAEADQQRKSAWRARLPDDIPIIRARLTPGGPIPGGPVFAFAGIGRPQKFFDALNAAGADLKATATFPDHHRYTRNDLNSLRESARRHNALLLTTEKDHVRLPAEMRRLIHAWPVTMRFEDEAKLDALLEKAMDRSARR